MKVFNIVMAVCFTALGFVYLALERDLQWWAASALMFAIAIHTIKDNVRNDS